MSVTFDQLLTQAKVELDSKGLYLSKKHRTCEATARLLVAVRAMIDGHIQSELKSETEKASLARQNSKLAAELADRERELKSIQASAFRRGLEAIPEVTQSQRDRLLTVNGS